MLEVLFNPTS